MTSQPKPNSIYQYSLLSALMAGIASAGIPASRLNAYTQGLGTFARIDGEMVLLDGQVYQLKSDGSVHIAAAADEIPFVMATKLQPQVRFAAAFASKDALHRALQARFPHSANLFIAYRVRNLPADHDRDDRGQSQSQSQSQRQSETETETDENAGRHNDTKAKAKAGGNWTHLKVRTVGGQQYHGQPLGELGDSQQVFEYADVRGEIVGFSSPPNWQGISVAGEHMHFIDQSRKFGGHVLELMVGEVLVEASVVSDLHIELPTGREFNEANLTVDDGGIKKVEG